MEFLRYDPKDLEHIFARGFGTWDMNSSAHLTWTKSVDKMTQSYFIIHGLCDTSSNCSTGTQSAQRAPYVYWDNLKNPLIQDGILGV